MIKVLMKHNIMGKVCYWVMNIIWSVAYTLKVGVKLWTLVRTKHNLSQGFHVTKVLMKQMLLYDTGKVCYWASDDFLYQIIISRRRENN